MDDYGDAGCGSYKTCGTALDDRRSPVNLDQLFAPLNAKSKECEDLQVAVSEQCRLQRQRPRATAKATSNLVNDVNARFSNDCTQTVGPYLDAADPSRNVSVHDLFKPLDRKSKEMQNLAVEKQPPPPTEEPAKSSHSNAVQRSRTSDSYPDEVNNDCEERQRREQPPRVDSCADGNASAPSNHDCGKPRTTENGAVPSRSETSLTQGEQESQTMSSSTWKSTAWAKFAPDKLKRTLLRRSSRNQPAAVAAVMQVKKSRFKVVPATTTDSSPRLLSSSCGDKNDGDGLQTIENGSVHESESEWEKLERSEHEAERQPLTAEYGGENKDKKSGPAMSSKTSETHWLGWFKAFRKKSSADTGPAPASSRRPFSR